METMHIGRGVSALIVATVVAGIVPGAAVGGQSQDEAKGAALIAEARKALGGEDKLSAITRLEIKGTSRRGQGAINPNFKANTFTK